ncbi:hypothetical protein BC830DRAFT_149802 [Chytriomyces sp. MP71]|nr:hypothetical protein BC830DRAFT_149802 [Chytriomyces sp. MP71]
MEALSILMNACLGLAAPHVPSSHIAKANRAHIHAPALLFLKRSNAVDGNTLQVWVHSLRALEKLDMMHLTGLSDLLLEYEDLEGKCEGLLRQRRAEKLPQRAPCFVKVPRKYLSLPVCTSTGNDETTLSDIVPPPSIKRKVSWISLLGF